MTSQKTGGCKCGGKCGKAKKDCTCGTKKIAPASTNPASTPAPTKPAPADKVDQSENTAPVQTVTANVPSDTTNTVVKKAGCGCAH